ncbi:hypothetical protein [Glutamicibacter sp. AOP5-A2-18]|uniref:hypothetical protein n=1 Tax=Glutamicibacter sp. AOP5-A2-18 TaxID=3457656 RepID=UPI00403346F1
MTLAEQFKCAIPTPDALKEGVLYCSTNATNGADIWSAVGTCFGVLVTVVMAIFAWKAWDTSRQQLSVAQHEVSENAFRYERTIQLESLFELLGVYSDLDSRVLEGPDAVREIAGRMRASEQKFAMLWEYPHFPEGLAAFDDCLLDAAYAANVCSNKTSGDIVIYRMLTTSKNRLFRDFYSGKLDGPLELDRTLRDLAEVYTEAHPKIFKHTLGPYSMESSKNHE